MLCNTQRGAAKTETRKWAGGAIRVESSFHSTLVPQEFCLHILVPVNNSAAGSNHLSSYGSPHWHRDWLIEVGGLLRRIVLSEWDIALWSEQNLGNKCSL